MLDHIPQCRAALIPLSSQTVCVGCAVNQTHLLHLIAGPVQRGALDLLSSADLTGGDTRGCLGSKQTRQVKQLSSASSNSN